jgi:HlyD family secretion protein
LKHGYRIVPLSAVLMAGVLAGWGCGKGEAEAPPPANEFALVERRNLDVKAEASGTIEPIRVVEVKSKASGEILRLPVETGDVVSRGDLLATIDPRDVQNAYNQAKADLDVAEARVANSESMLKRTDELRKANVATEQELEQAQLDIANQRAQLVKAQTNLQLAEERLKDVTIGAPISGVVIERPVEVGTIIASASQNVSGGTTLMKMADLAQMQVRALIDETDLGKIKPGMAVQVSVEAYPERKFQGTVLKIEPQAVIDQNVTMFPVLVELDNAAGLLKVGMNADVEIQIASRENVIVVPNSAVVTTRDAVTAGAALGMTEEQVRTALQPARPANPEQAGPQQGSPAAAQAGSPPAGGAQGAECQALMTKARESGFQNLSEADRAKMTACRPAGQTGGRQGGGGRGGQNGRGGRGAGPRNADSRPGVVFVAKADGTFEPRNVTLGVNDFDYSEVLRGLQEGEQVVMISVARLQQAQQDFLNRMRERAGGNGPIPGGGGPPPGGGGGRGGR